MSHGWSSSCRSETVRYAKLMTFSSRCIHSCNPFPETEIQHRTFEMTNKLTKVLRSSGGIWWCTRAVEWGYRCIFLRGRHEEGCQSPAWETHLSSVPPRFLTIMPSPLTCHLLTKSDGDRIWVVPVLTRANKVTLFYLYWWINHKLKHCLYVVNG